MKLIIDYIKRSTLVLLTMLSIASVPTTVVYAADTKTAVCQGVGIANDAGDCTDNGFDAMGIIRNVIQFLVIIIGAIAVIMVIVGGFKYITSQGDSNKAASAKNTILYAAIGIIIVLFAQALITFVLDKATEATTQDNSIHPSSQSNP